MSLVVGSAAPALAFTTPTLAVSLYILGGLLVLAVVAAFGGRALIRRGLREPWVLRRINRVSERIVDAVKRPITIAVLDEVADVLQTGNYTRNIAAALRENQDEIRTMVAEKIKEDPAAGRISLIPFHDRIIDQASETTLRVILEVLADPRTDELVSDLLRDNITQIRQAVRNRESELTASPVRAGCCRPRRPLRDVADDPFVGGHRLALAVAVRRRQPQRAVGGGDDRPQPPVLRLQRRP